MRNEKNEIANLKIIIKFLENKNNSDDSSEKL